MTLSKGQGQTREPRLRRHTANTNECSAPSHADHQLRDSLSLFHLGEQETGRGGRSAPAGAEVSDRRVNRSPVCCDAMPPVIYLPQWVCVYIGAGVGGVVEGKGGGVAHHSARSHFAALWNPELNRVAFL